MANEFANTWQAIDYVQRIAGRAIARRDKSGLTQDDVRRPVAPVTITEAQAEQITGCCAYALDNLYTRQIELASAESILADYEEQGADPAVLRVLEDAVLILTGRVRELEDLRDSECSV